MITPIVEYSPLQTVALYSPESYQRKYYLCGGPVPDEAALNALATIDHLIAVSPSYEYEHIMLSQTDAAVAAGEITHLIMDYEGAPTPLRMLATVGLPGSGADIYVSKTQVAVGDVVMLYPALFLMQLYPWQYNDYLPRGG